MSDTHNQIFAHKRKLLPKLIPVHVSKFSDHLRLQKNPLFVPHLSGTIFEPLTLGGPQCSCQHCGALFWYDERVRRERHTQNPTYNLCCKGGKVSLQPYDPPPQPLLDLLTSQNSSLSSHFFHHIRQYNTMFAMTSMGAKIDESINDGRGPYIFKISGQVCHRVGSMRPSRGQRPEYAQLYIFDTECEVSNRINVASSSRTGSSSCTTSSSRIASSTRTLFQANEGIVQSLITMLNTHNPIVKLFRTASQRLHGNDSDHLYIRIYGKPDAHGDIYSAPVASEVVGLVVGDLGSSNVGRDIIIEDHSSRLQQINEKHCKFMSMQYPLLFPYGEDGYHDELMCLPVSNASNQRQKVTMLEYYAYRLHDRPNDFNTPLRCKRLTQAYFVDGYCSVETFRIAFYRKPSFQRKYRSSSFSCLADSVSKGITSGSSVGQRIILPSSFTGGPRYLYQNYQDSIAICRKYGCPDLFVTFTSNAAWPEITEALSSIPGQEPSDRPDIVNRVFKMKLNILMDDIKKKQFFGPINAGNKRSLKLIFPSLNIVFCRLLNMFYIPVVIYTVEFQKRGLPHVHIIIWLAKEAPLDAQKIDSYISAQLPDPVKDPIGYEVVSSFMVHGPCGPLGQSSPCMSEGKCTKFYPKEFCEQTTVRENGFTEYARPNNGITARKNNVDIDNRFIVPHNVDLVVKYQAHINVEKVNHDGMHKYLFKYVTKGFDCARIGLHGNFSTSASSTETVNEIDNYLECRCVTPNDAAWRLQQYDIHHTDPSVERLPVHLPLENNVIYSEDDNLEQVIEDPQKGTTKLTAWLDANMQHPEARQYTYIEFPEYWTWHQQGKYWDHRRGPQKKIG
uniref:Helitron helicase-like domain-containing protein n=1 Tax=Triticum urartu TaxID=4572 RepID=A0A8R7R995_TRIUA